MAKVIAPRQTALGDNLGLRSDPCVKTVEEQQSVQPCEYQLTNFYGFCDIDQPQQLRIEERGNQLWNGYHVALGCNVDNDSKLRLDSVLHYVMGEKMQDSYDGMRKIQWVRLNENVVNAIMARTA